MSRAGFGTAKYGATNFKKTGKPGPGENAIRILPPMHSLASNGRGWKRYEKTHWGWVGAGKEPGRTSPRPFRCVRQTNRSNKMVTVECAACLLYEKHEAEAKEMETQLEAKVKAGEMTEEEMKTAMAPYVDWLKAHNVEAKNYVNVMYEDGSFGDYKLNYKFHMSRIDAYCEGDPENGIKSLIETDGIDPIDLDQGVWFVIKRTGDGFKVPDTVELKYETEVVNGRPAKFIKLAPLTDEQCTKALEQCRDLSTLGGETLTPEQIQALVDCSGDPEEVDRIMGPRNGQEAPAPTAPAPAPTPTTVQPKPVVVKPTPTTTTPATAKPTPAAAPAPAATTAAKPQTLSPAVQEMLAKRKAEIEAKKRAAEEEARVKAEAEKITAGLSAEDAEALASLEMSDEDFMTKFGKDAG